MKKYLLILSTFLIALSLCGCQKESNLSQEINVFDIKLKVNETLGLSLTNTSNNIADIESEKIKISISKEQYSTDVPKFEEVADKFISDLNSNEENTVLVNDNNKVIVIDKKLENKSNDTKNKNYTIDGLYLNDKCYYSILYYGDYDSMLENKDWIIESLKTVSFNS